MTGLEVTVVLGAAVLAGAVLAPRLRVPTPLLLVVLGLTLGLVPQLRAVELPPETVLLLFLPVILFWESLTTSLRSIRRGLPGIVLLSTVLVVASAVGAAFVAWWLGLPWDAARPRGRARPAGRHGRRLARAGAPRRRFMLLKAESLTNDGTALVVYGIAIGVATGGHYSALDVTGLVALSYGGGLLAGALTGGLAYLVLRPLRDPLAINTGLLLTPFTAYLVAELVGASGVLAVVVAGLLASWVWSRISTASSRRQTELAWPLGSFVLNGALFVLVGLEVQAVGHDVGGTAAARLAGLVVAVWLALLVVRFAVPQLAALVAGALGGSAGAARRGSWRGRVVSAVAGFRGAVSLAIALSVPVTLDDGSPFPGRDAVVLATAGVVVLTLLVQGPLLPLVLRWADLPADDDATSELALAERELTAAAVAALPGLATEHGVRDEVRDRVARDHADVLRLVDGRELAGSGTDDDVPDGLVPIERHDEDLRLRLALLDRKREALLRLRRSGAVDDAVVRRVQARLDLEELRLTGVEPLG